MTTTKKTTDTVKEETVKDTKVTPPKAKKTVTEKKSVEIKIWDVVKYSGVEAAVTGIDKLNTKLYLDTPVCAWVDMKDCRL